MIRSSAYRWRPKREAEEDIQAGVIALLRSCADPAVIYFHCPNGLHSNPIHVARFKRLGLKAGVADLCLVLPKGRAAFLEVKAKDGRQSEAQKAFQIHCELNGTPYAIVRSISEAEQVLSDWGALRVTQRRAA